MSKITIDNVEKALPYLDKINSFATKLEWVEPVYITAVKAHKVFNNDNTLTKNTYIDSMLLNSYNQSKTYSPIEHIHSRGENIETTAKHIAEVMLKNYIHLPDIDKKDLKDYMIYLFTEMMNNVIDHSQSSIGGYTMAQYYPTHKSIQFSIADKGIGFLENVKDEVEAIEKALEKGFTANKTNQLYGSAYRNAGYGLYIMSEIIKQVGGKFIIISNNGLYRYNALNDKYEKKILDYSFNGVLVAFEFKEEKINFSMQEMINFLLAEDEEDFY
ncbi:ATP-binding protein [Caminibacter sp.]